MSFTFELSQISGLIDLKRYRAILCLDGYLPDPEFILRLELPVIAADGAANQLISQGVAPDVVIGDLDSVDYELLARLNCVRIDDQDSSDFQKAITYMRPRELLPCIILGMTGGYADHILNNISIFNDCDESIFLTPSMLGQKLTQNDNFSFPLNTKLSVFGFPKGIITTKGLRWNLTKSQLEFCGINSCFNRTVSETFSVTIHSGSVLLLTYLEGIIDAGAQGRTP
ncbi:MAG: thiamine diphosphokinase [Holosporales bacterium]|jgi:thiamine pyrophosphokinase|nr:thiamine diphosphokinase [Holosporales bacterium]